MRQIAYNRHHLGDIFCFPVSSHRQNPGFDINEIYRLLKHALELKKPVMLLNVGPTRADGVPGVEKIDIASGMVIRDVARAVM